MDKWWKTIVLKLIGIGSPGALGLLRFQSDPGGENNGGSPKRSCFFFLILICTSRHIIRWIAGKIQNHIYVKRLARRFALGEYTGCEQRDMNTLHIRNIHLFILNFDWIQIFNRVGFHQSLHTIHVRLYLL